MTKKAILTVPAIIAGLIGIYALIHLATRRHVEVYVESPSVLMAVELTVVTEDGESREATCTKHGLTGKAYSCEYTTNDSDVWGWAGYPEEIKVAMHTADGKLEWPRDRCKLSRYAVTAYLNGEEGSLQPEADYCCNCTRTFDWATVYSSR